MPSEFECCYMLSWAEDECLYNPTGPPFMLAFLCLNQGAYTYVLIDDLCRLAVRMLQSSHLTGTELGWT